MVTRMVPGISLLGAPAAKSVFCLTLAAVVLACWPVNAQAQNLFNHETNDRCGLVAGFTGYYLFPSLNQNTAFIQVTPTTNAAGDTFNQTLTPELISKPGFAPLYTLGWASPSGFGIRARYFYFRKSSETFNITNDNPNNFIRDPLNADPDYPNVTVTRGGATVNQFGSPGLLVQLGAGAGAGGVDNLTFNSSMRLYTFDFETTYSKQWQYLEIILAGGGRYLGMSQDYQATLVNTSIPGLSESQTFLAGRNFYGGGPTVSFTGRLNLGDSNFAIYGGLRGSLLIGLANRSLTFTETLDDPNNVLGGSANVTSTTQTVSTRVLPVLEEEVGLEFILGDSGVFLRAGVVNQTYFDAGNATSQDGNLGLFGGQITFGVNF